MTTHGFDQSKYWTHKAPTSTRSSGQVASTPLHPTGANSTRFHLHDRKRLLALSRRDTARILVATSAALATNGRINPSLEDTQKQQFNCDTSMHMHLSRGELQHQMKRHALHRTRLEGIGRARWCSDALRRRHNVVRQCRRRLGALSSLLGQVPRHCKLFRSAPFGGRARSD